MAERGGVGDQHRVGRRALRSSRRSASTTRPRRRSSTSPRPWPPSWRPTVRVNAIAPGLVKTDMARALWEPAEEADRPPRCRSSASASPRTSPTPRCSWPATCRRGSPARPSSSTAVPWSPAERPLAPQRLGQPAAGRPPGRGGEGEGEERPCRRRAREVEGRNATSPATPRSRAPAPRWLDQAPSRRGSDRRTAPLRRSPRPARATARSCRGRIPSAPRIGQFGSPAAHGHGRARG